MRTNYVGPALLMGRWRIASSGEAAASSLASARWSENGGGPRTTSTARQRQGSPRSCQGYATG